MNTRLYTCTHIQDVSLDGGGGVHEESVLRLIEILEVPRHQVCNSLLNSFALTMLQPIYLALFIVLDLQRVGLRECTFNTCIPYMYVHIHT
jgi:hypothetical protein